jgi:hypothetical protein
MRRDHQLLAQGLPRHDLERPARGREAAGEARAPNVVFVKRAAVIHGSSTTPSCLLGRHHGHRPLRRPARYRPIFGSAVLKPLLDAIFSGRSEKNLLQCRPVSHLGCSRMLQRAAICEGFQTYPFEYGTLLAFVRAARTKFPEATIAARPRAAGTPRLGRSVWCVYVFRLRTDATAV